MSIRKSLKKVLPPISITEQEALDAGDIWLEASIYQGKPDMAGLRNIPAATLTAEEQAFIDGPVQKVIDMVDDYELQHQTHIPQHILDFLSANKFFALIIPKAFGGLEFSPYANSTIVSLLASKSSTVAVTVMVPNSLGPGELLMHYGTPEQQQYWLPKLAVGQDIPCFALTGPDAGSDAGAIPDAGIVTKGMWEGKEVIGLSVSWDKRYITLAPIATVLGLAFKVFDPQGLIGDKVELGITCALIPKSHPGVELGNRHNPMDVRFYNGTTRGKNVFIPMDFIIGGQKNIGRGWQMLVACLGAGRGISLPAMGTATAQAALKSAVEYSFVREQFGVPIGRFEGIQEKLADMAGKTFLLESMRVLTTEGLGLGLKPSVITAMAKYHITELGRDVLISAMDIQGGKAIQMGPQNTLASAYKAQPIAITVEGANILTRSLMIFGQGAMRCHPYLKDMVELIHSDEKGADSKFNSVLMKTVNYGVANGFRSLFQSYLPMFRKQSSKLAEVRPYEKRMSKLSANLATMADLALGVLGGNLKKAEMLSARLGDMMSYMYMTMAAIRYYEQKVDASIRDQAKPYFEYGVAWALQQCEKAQADFVDNFPNSAARGLMRLITKRYSNATTGVSDDLVRQLAEASMENNAFKAQISHLVKATEGDGYDINTQAFEAKHKVLPILNKIQKTLRSNPVAPATSFDDMLVELQKRGDLDSTEVAAVTDYNEKRKVAVRVDEYDFDLNLLSDAKEESSFEHKPAA
ncbi:acyl-CoA dehydrogenase [Paraneptunicella aestuarii]|uniref:acyl-CoA dehydrogenase n=1 Tax=Paraneptunicella aestuarii TaxID=2831148 RepID=UPI001E32DB4E|nr:acyl-CoA dehydrogenase [Paraneptunicella aestuarii]UAA38943.1 acyl-CoA dehydrogenase [Paraneptunicella aestuarii]